MAKRRHNFSAFGLETEETNKLAKTKFALTCSFQKMIRAFTYGGHLNCLTGYFFIFM